jgi:hypothetical protein
MIQVSDFNNFHFTTTNLLNIIDQFFFDSNGFKQ